MKLLPSPQIQPIDKDAVIDALKRKLIATEYRMELYKENWLWSSQRELKYFEKLQALGIDPDGKDE